MAVQIPINIGRYRMGAIRFPFLNQRNEVVDQWSDIYDSRIG